MITMDAKLLLVIEGECVLVHAYCNIAIRRCTGMSRIGVRPYCLHTVGYHQTFVNFERDASKFFGQKFLPLKIS